jgi:hypothetical protein
VPRVGDASGRGRLRQCVPREGDVAARGRSAQTLVAGAVFEIIFLQIFV